MRKLDPAIDITRALDSMTGSGVDEPTASLERPEGVESDAESAPSLDRFEWSEPSSMSPSRVRKDTPDGMALLPTKRSESGYLGKVPGACGKSFLISADLISRQHLRVDNAQRNFRSPS